ncbi:hypothetical protein RIF29_31011 [Crotalaria pallida]|uniref:Cytochrome c oxidase copper chaperone n=1 Tax=Crotalaria pallida TaxID=3830 RepID=A0AAN9EGR9_CROPI
MSGVELQSASSAWALQGSQKVEGSVTVATAAESKPKKKICCACPDTKKLRDECIVENGEAACTKWIEAHRLCLRAEGFNVECFQSCALATDSFGLKVKPVPTIYRMSMSIGMWMTFLSIAVHKRLLNEVLNLFYSINHIMPQPWLLH